jgi:hypothetical protein
MSSNEVDIQLIAFDQASSVIESVGSNLSTTFTDIEGSTQELATTTDDATSQMTAGYNQVNESAQSMADTTNTTSMSCSNATMSMNGAALAGMSLYMSFNNLQNSEVALDRAHVTLERATLAVQKAQESYNATVAKYGPDSQQAKDAADKLTISQDALRVAQERADMSQRNVNNSMVMAALTVIPSLIAIVNTVANAQQIWTGIQWALNIAMDANPAAIIALAIAGLVAIVIAAYNACPPFRNAINEIGVILGGSFRIAVEAITIGLTWFWKNVIEPLANFVRAYVVTEIRILSDVVSFLWNNAFKPLGDFLAGVFYTSIKVVSDIVNFMWNSVLKPLGDFLIGAFSTAWKVIQDVIKAVYDVVKPIIDAVEGAAKTMGKFVDTVSGAMKGAGNAIGGFIHSICFAHALEDAANSSEKTMKGWVGMVGDSMDKGLKTIKDFNSQAQIGGTQMVGSIAAGGALPTGPSKPTAVNLDIKAPLVYIEGSSDKATADLASKQVLKSLQTIIVEPTSSASASTQKRIRSGSVF